MIIGEGKLKKIQKSRKEWANKETLVALQMEVPLLANVLNSYSSTH